MQARQAEPSRGWQWIVEGWRLFIKSPGLWVLLLLLNIAIGVVLSWIPLVGQLAYALVMPALGGGLLYAADQLERGHELEFGFLFRAFQERALTNPMLTLGLVSLAGTAVTALVGGSAVLGGLVGVGALGPDHASALGMVAGVGILALLVTLLIALALSMALLYGVPLVMLAGVPPKEAMMASVSATLTNALPLLVFGLIYVVLAVLAAIPLGLGFLVLGPVTVGSIYASFRDVFPEALAPPVTVPLAPPPPPPG